MNLFRELADSLLVRAGRLDEAEREQLERSAARPRDDAVAQNAWLDIDRVLDEYCRARGLTKPADAAQLMELHVEALVAWSSHFIEERSIMKKSDSQSLHKTLAFAATLAALGVSVGVPVEQALAAQVPGAHEDRAARTRPLELAFTLVEQPGQKQGMADGSVKSARRSAGRVGANQLKIDRARAAGARQGK